MSRWTNRNRDSVLFDGLKTKILQIVLFSNLRLLWLFIFVLHGVLIWMQKCHLDSIVMWFITRHYDMCCEQFLLKYLSFKGETLIVDLFLVVFEWTVPFSREKQKFKKETQRVNENHARKKKYIENLKNLVIKFENKN